MAVKAACTLAIRCSSAARQQVLAPSLAKAVLQATQVFLTKDESKGVECLDALVDAAGEAPAFLAADAGQLLGLVGAAANAAQFEPETRSRALEVALALAEAAPAVTAVAAAVQRWWLPRRRWLTRRWPQRRRFWHGGGGTGKNKSATFENNENNKNHEKHRKF